MEEPLQTMSVSGSSQIRQISYQPDSDPELGGYLRVTFIRGQTYEYYNVPPRIWEAFKEAVATASPGEFFHRVIDGRYGYRKIGGR